MPENGSPIYAVIKNIIEHFQISNNTILYSYKCPLHFDFLWNLMGTLPLNPENISKTFVIVWDGMPARNSQDDFANTSKYLTPIDWAIGLSLSVQMAITNHNEAQHEYPDLKILIFTPEPQITLNTDAIRLVEQFPRRDIKYLPWVRIFSPGHKDKVNNIDAFFNTLIDTDNLIRFIRLKRTLLHEWP